MTETTITITTDRLAKVAERIAELVSENRAANARHDYSNNHDNFLQFEEVTGTLRALGIVWEIEGDEVVVGGTRQLDSKGNVTVTGGVRCAIS